MLRKPNVLFLLMILTAIVSCSFPDERISNASKNETCSQDLLGALSAFSSDLGLPYQVSSEDAKTIFDQGEVSKSYGRDGYRYTVTFGLETKKDGCHLVFYKKKKVGPGYESTSKSDFGSVLLHDCECENSNAESP